MAVLALPDENGRLIRSSVKMIRDESSTSSLLEARDKPYKTSDMALPIALGVAIPVIIALGVLYYLHRRSVKKQRMEDAKDPNRDLDFGLGDTPMTEGKKKSRKSFLLGGEKNSHKTSQLSMDMNLSSPYLLPPQHQNSHDSVHSINRSYANEYDPYQIVNSEVGSIKSFGKDSRQGVPPPRQGSFPKSSMSSSDKVDAFPAPPTHPDPVRKNPSPMETREPLEAIKPVKAVVPEIGHVHEGGHRDTFASQSASIQEPPPAAAKRPEDRVTNPPIDQQFDFGLPQPAKTSGGAVDGPSDAPPRGLDFDIQPMSPMDDLMFSNQGASDPIRSAQSPPPTQTQTTARPGERESKESFYDDQPQIRTSEYYVDLDDYDERGRLPERQGSLNLYGQSAQPQQNQGGLGVPHQETKRLSVGFRPLPPEDALESEDPEYRANRIRSFYKEYFEDSKEAPPPVPGLPPQHAPGGAQYYEDYDERYLGEAAYFDPDTNAFVMPGAQPVHRRAMTPPPAGRRGPPGPGPRGGPRGPGRPHGPHGSLGGMSLPGGPRSKSAFGPRPDSSASRGKKNLPPPTALNTLPTPSKLKDDSFALMNATDFAPPEAFSERARGRSQSPLGERRPYQPKLPAASPLVNAFEELNALPSPHLLRKSSTFTGLDFLPPKKFKDQDTSSDAGSIRSNKSGISAQAVHAIRSGAGRVSRLPGDQVFTQQAMASELKPQWTMRP